MLGKWRGFKVVVHRIHPDNLTYLKTEMDRLDVAATVARDNGQNEDAAAMCLAWSALHLAHGLLERALASSSFASVKIVSGRPHLRVGRAHSFTLSWGARSQGPNRPWRRLLYLQLLGFQLTIRLWETKYL